MCDTGRDAVSEEGIELIGREDPGLISAGGTGVKKERGQDRLEANGLVDRLLDKVKDKLGRAYGGPKNPVPLTSDYPLTTYAGANEVDGGLQGFANDLVCDGGAQVDGGLARRELEAEGGQATIEACVGGGEGATRAARAAATTWGGPMMWTSSA